MSSLSSFSGGEIKPSSNSPDPQMRRKEWPRGVRVKDIWRPSNLIRAEWFKNMVLLQSATYQLQKMWAASPSHGPSPKVSGQAGAGTSHLRDWHWKTLQTWKHPILDCKSIRDPANELCFSRSFHSQGCNGITPISASDWFWWHCWWPWLQDFAEQTAITQGVSAKWSWFCDGWLATSNTRIIQYLYKYRYAMSFPCARKSSDFLLKARAFTLTSLLLNRFWNNFAESTQKLQTNPHDQHPLAHVSFGDMSLMLRVPGSGTTTLDESHPLRVGRVRRSSPATFKSFSEKKHHHINDINISKQWSSWRLGPKTDKTRIQAPRNRSWHASSESKPANALVRAFTCPKINRVFPKLKPPDISGCLGRCNETCVTCRSANDKCI